MAGHDTYDSLFRQLQCCVIVPTYNNSGSLGQILDRLIIFTRQIIVVNDGSTDGTRMVLSKYPDLTVISYSRNRGKGYALRTGFEAALRMGFEYAITIDSDGQHHPEDLLALLQTVSTDPGALIIGSRNLDQDGIPKGTTFGNRFSNFWMWVETGLRLPDTQSGFRLYPLLKMKGMRFHTRRFEFEIEVLVRAAWKGIRIIPVPVKVHYPPKEERVSHFRPFTDFTRISLLNSVLTILALLFVRPFLFIRTLDKENIRIFYRKYLLSPEESNFKKAASIAVGICIGILPIWGWQIATAIAVSYFLRLNKALTVVASNISIPPMIPFILYGSYAMGGVILDTPTELVGGVHYTLEFVKQNLLQYLIGAVALAISSGLAVGLFTWLLLSVFRRRQSELLVDKINPGEVDTI
jgi:glycosyltransferase involved in cell wall biosynthesis